jgi:glycosyltransferase involved in cell wall biosynthesis
MHFHDQNRLDVSRRFEYPPPRKAGTTWPTELSRGRVADRFPEGGEADRLDVLYFGNDWSADNRTSSHHIATRLGSQCRLIYVECPGLRAPAGSKRDVGKIVRKLAACFRGPRDSGAGFPVVTLFQLPFHRYRVVRALNRFLARRAVRGLVRRYGLRSPVVHMTVPHVSHLIARVGERMAVYYCVDDYSAIPGVNVEAVRAMDDEATRKSDLVFVVSQTLLRAKRAANPNTRLSPHGVDAAHFAAARRPGPVPADVAGLRGPVVGYFGLVEEYMDWEMVAWLAAQRPDWQFVLIGRVAVPPDRLPVRPNLHFLGRRPYADLPAYGRRFDAAIIPSRLDHRFAQHASPLKLREYLAMGVPVVAAATPENRKFADVAALAETREQFLAHLDGAVGRPITAAEAARRMARVADQTWESRADTVLAAVRDAYAAKAAIKAAVPRAEPADESPAVVAVPRYA